MFYITELTHRRSWNYPYLIHINCNPPITNILVTEIKAQKWFSCNQIVPLANLLKMFHQFKLNKLCLFQSRRELYFECNIWIYGTKYSIESSTIQKYYTPVRHIFSRKSNSLPQIHALLHTHLVLIWYFAVNN